MPDDILELDYGGYTVEHWDVGTDSEGRGLAIRQTIEDGISLWRFSHVCRRRDGRVDPPDGPNSGEPWRIAPRLTRPNEPGGHQILSTDPLHIEPSILCTSCGIHGWVRDGRWVPA